MSNIKSIIFASGLVMMASAAQAELRICNETNHVQSISIGYNGDHGWTSEGWWNINPHDCTNVVQGDLKQRYYYLRAEVEGGPFTGEGYFFCTTPSEYTIYGDTNCRGRGYDREDFVEIDTGTTSTRFRYTLR